MTVAHQGVYTQRRRLVYCVPFSVLSRGIMNFPVATRNPGQTTFAAVTMGMLAMLRAWMVLYPSRHTGFTGSPLLIAFEVVKTTALLMILGRVYLLNGKADDQAVRSKHERTFTMAASVSVLIDISISISTRYF